MPSRDTRRSRRADGQRVRRRGAAVAVPVAVAVANRIGEHGAVGSVERRGLVERRRFDLADANPGA